MDLIKNLISQLDAATSNRTVEFLVICIIILMVFTIIHIICKAAKKLFCAIFCRKKKQKPKTTGRHEKKKTLADRAPDKANSSENKDSVPRVSEPTAEAEKHRKEAESVLDVLKATIANHSEPPSEHNIPTPISLNSDHPLYTAEKLSELEYNLTDEETQSILNTVSGKSVEELKKLLKSAQDRKKNNQVLSDSDKSKYLKLVGERQRLQTEEETAVETFNQEVEEFLRIDASTKQARADAFNKLIVAQEVLAALIQSESETSALLKQQREDIIAKTLEAHQFLNAYTTTHGDSEDSTQKATHSLSDSKKTAEICVSALQENDAAISLLTGKIAENNKKLALSKIFEQTICKEIERLEAEEAQRLAEEKERKEAEARARAEEEARRREEERLAAEQKRIEEEKRLAEEKAERERLQAEAEQKAREEREKEAAFAAAEQKQREAAEEEALFNRAMQNVADREQELLNPNRVLTPEEEAEQARITMEAQRARRRAMAQQKNAGAGESNPVQPSSAPIEEAPKAEPTSQQEEEKPQPSATPEPISKQPKAQKPSDNEEDTKAASIMAELKKQWAAENEAKERFAREQAERAAEYERRRKALAADNNQSNN